jgi:hypothetical protein
VSLTTSAKISVLKWTAAVAHGGGGGMEDSGADERPRLRERGHKGGWQCVNGHG